MGKQALSSQTSSTLCHGISVTRVQPCWARTISHFAANRAHLKNCLLAHHLLWYETHAVRRAFRASVFFAGLFVWSRCVICTLLKYGQLAQCCIFSFLCRNCQEFTAAESGKKTANVCYSDWPWPSLRVSSSSLPWGLRAVSTSYIMIKHITILCVREKLKIKNLARLWSLHDTCSEVGGWNGRDSGKPTRCLEGKQSLIWRQRKRMMQAKRMATCSLALSVTINHNLSCAVD